MSVAANGTEISDMTDKERDLMERRLKGDRVKKRAKNKNKNKRSLLTLELFLRTMSLMTMDRSSSFSCKRKDEQVYKTVAQTGGLTTQSAAESGSSLSRENSVQHQQPRDEV